MANRKIKRRKDKQRSSKQYTEGLGVRVIVFDDNFNNVSVISWRSDLLVEETRENYTDLS